MARWRWKGPDYHEMGTFRDVLPDGTVIFAKVVDCDGDVEYWHVEENGVRVAGGDLHGADVGSGRELCERVINYGAKAVEMAA